MNPQEAFTKAYNDRATLGQEINSIQLAIDGQRQKLAEARTRYSSVDKIVKAAAAEMGRSTIQIGRGRPPGSVNKKLADGAMAAIAKAKRETIDDFRAKQAPKKAAKKARA